MEAWWYDELESAVKDENGLVVARDVKPEDGQTIQSLCDIARMVRDMIDGGRLREDMIPDDYEAVTEALDWAETR